MPLSPAEIGLLLFFSALLLSKLFLPLSRLTLRTLAGLAILELLSLGGGPLGIALGVNLFNALVLGVLGLPGFGLLLLLLP